MSREDKDYRIYKPTKSNSGSAIALQIRPVDQEKNQYGTVLVFLQGAKQIPSEGENHAFGWKDGDSNINMKLDAVDIGELLAVFNKKKEFVGSDEKYGIFHKNKHGSTGLKMKAKEDGYAVRLSKKPNEGNLVAITLNISFPEAEVLKVLLQKAVERLFAW